MRKLLLLLVILALPVMIILLQRNTSHKIEKKPTTFNEDHLVLYNDIKEKKLIEVEAPGQVMELDMEEYIVGVVAAEMPASFEEEALKAQAIAARTYAVRKLLNGEKLSTDYRVCQAYWSVDNMKKQWGDSYEVYKGKIEKAVYETSGQVILYDGKPIQAVFHAMSAGATRGAGQIWPFELPYLKSVDSSFEKGQKGFEVTSRLSEATLAEKLGQYKAHPIKGVDDIVHNTKVSKYSDEGYALEVSIGKEKLTGEEFRMALGLRSSHITLKSTDKGLLITSRGYGHGVGMSQVGANQLAKMGKDHTYILNHYYQGTQISS